VWFTPVSTDNEINLQSRHSTVDFATMPNIELELLNSSQTDPSVKEKWKLDIGIMNFVGKQCFS
jgi:hypothetical protein